ncbi:hypothetical protein [Lacrimispora sp.]|nr:hypothetical protein [Lacrimispora sp.]
MNPLNFYHSCFTGMVWDYGTSPKAYGQMLQRKRRRKKGRKKNV